MKKAAFLLVLLTTLIYSENLFGVVMLAHSVAKAKDSIKVKKIEAKLIKRLQQYPGDIQHGQLLIGIWRMNERIDECYALLDTLLIHCNNTTDSIDIFRAKADFLQSQDRYKEALLYYDTLISKEGSIYYDLCYKADCYFKTDQIKDAIGILKKGYVEKCASRLSYIAWLWDKLGETGKAEQYYIQALKHKPVGADIKSTYATHLIRHKKFTEAISLIKDYQNDFTSFHGKTYSLYTEFYMYEGNFPKAKQMLHKARKIYPHFWGNHYLEALLHIEMKEYEKAELILASLITSKPSSLLILYSLAETQMYLGHSEKALQTLQKVSDNTFVGLQYLLKNKAFSSLHENEKFKEITKEISQREEIYKKELLSLGL